MGAWLGSARAARLERIGLQLYTVRREVEKDPDGTLAAVAAIGYREVEIFELYGRSPKEFRSSLDRHGLDAPSMHVGLWRIQTQWNETLDAASELGLRYVVCAWLEPDERESLEQYRENAETFNRAGEQARARGLQLAYHNHDFEFEPMDGGLPYDLLLDETDPELVRMEMDLYWITKGGGDPLEYFRRYPGRFHLVHVKDMDRTAERGMTEAGKGIIDFRGIFAQAKLGGIQHFFVEHDEPASAIESARESYRYLESLDF